MREIKEDRFKKKEDIEFHPVAIPEPPVLSTGGIPPVIKNGATAPPFERTNERANSTPFGTTAYKITIPKQRRKTRQSFDIFEDQYDALKKLQLAKGELTQSKTSRKLGELVQEALDRFIRDKTERLGNITVVRE
jgi:hypothetical protein